MKVEDTADNVDLCICVDCPTYNACMKEGDERLFCGKDKSGCDIASQGCICGQCPITGMYDLEGMYYCLNGAAG